MLTSAIVFMAHGIVDNWIPLAYYLANESCRSADVKVEPTGLEVVAVVSEIGSNFQKLIREMGNTLDKPWFILYIQ